ncbi:uncharacterized protein [Epargyreus clarus]|uniref:uncharacterized protein n=1 Tax=Epargyreus clarus TaxID=520877 RepID=UPI003C2F276F
MKGSRKKSATSSDLDDIPIKLVPKVSGRRLTIKELRRFSIQACEFCEKKFENRYDILVHNSKHIIIPLIKQKPRYCTECGWYCISEEHLNDHISIKHKDIQHEFDTQSKISERIQFETDNLEFDSDKLTKDDAIDKLIQIELGVETNGSILENFVKSCKVDVEKFELTMAQKDKNIAEKINKDICRKNSVNRRNTVVKNEPSSDMSVLDDPISLLRPSNGNLREYEREYSSVHFDELMKPGIFHCKHCYKRFPNRYGVIVHELIHLDLSKAITNRRIRRDYKRQFTIQTHATKASHKFKTNKKKGLSDEDYSPGKKYRGVTEKSLSTEKEESAYKHHCSICKMGCTSKRKKLAHEEKCLTIGTKTIHMCDTCTFSMKNKKKLEYTTVGKLCNLIAKPECQRCGKSFHEVSLVRLTPKRQKMVNRIRFESSDDRQSKASHPPHLTNRARLKNIQNRLKLINKYNALYKLFYL